MPWYVRWVVGIGAWVTAVVLIALGGVFVFQLLDLNSPAALAVFGAALLGAGLWLLRQPASGIFARQLGVATAAAGTALASGGLAGEAESTWVGFAVAAAATAIIVTITTDKILQFLAAALAVGFYVFAVSKGGATHALDFVALATPAGLALLLYPPRRDLLPTAVVLLLTFPFVTMLGWPFLGDWADRAAIGRILHILLFLWLVYLHWSQSGSGQANLQVLGFAVAAVAVCLLLPPGGSAAMLILMLAFVIGSKPFALLGSVLQAQFIVRYYYSLEMNLLDKSLLLMGVGAVLVVLWWLLRRKELRGVAL